MFFSVTYGVDWSNNASPSSHCWFPLTDADSLGIKKKSRDEATMLQCGSCALVTHSHHSEDLIKPCRPSFSDANDDSSKSDEHFWSYVSALSVPCAHCQQSSILNNFFGSGSMPSSLQILDQVTGMINSISEIFNPQISDRSSDGLVCLWCSRGYHQSCWENLSSDKKIECDYGIFQ